MTSPSSPLPSNHGQERAVKIRDFFANIAGIYDFFNHFFSAGIDVWWRYVLIHRVLHFNPHHVLDLATGSGDVALAMTKRGLSVTGADFCVPMLEQAAKKGLRSLVTADALHLPFPSEQFDAVTIAFGLRNLVDREQGLREIHRVLKPGGRVHILEFSTPCRLLRPFYYWYLGNMMPWITQILFRQGDAYRHLNDSIRSFPDQEGLAKELASTRFTDIGYTNLTFGIAAIHTGKK